MFLPGWEFVHENWFKQPNIQFILKVHCRENFCWLSVFMKNIWSVEDMHQQSYWHLKSEEWGISDTQQMYDLFMTLWRQMQCNTRKHDGNVYTSSSVPLLSSQLIPSDRTMYRSVIFTDILSHVMLQTNVDLKRKKKKKL